MIGRALSTSASKPATVVIFGGNGFVGTNIAKNILTRNPTTKVISISRSGQPKVIRDGLHQVEWLSSDVFRPESYRDKLADADCVVSCIGAFGSNEFMERMNGDANILAASEAICAKAKRFIYISTSENTLPEFVLKG